MAALMKAVLDNKTCKKIISTEKYNTGKTKQHPDGMELYSFVFKNIYEYGQDPDFEIGGGKTGYAKWCHMLAKQPLVEYDTSWCEVIK